MERIEKFISENRKDLDTHAPSSDVWRRIESNSSYSVWRISRKVLSVAASIIIILGTASVIFMLTRSDTIGTSGLKGSLGSDGYNELKETSLYYGNQLSEMLLAAQPLFVNHPDIGIELQKDFDDLDRVAAELMNDLRDNADNKEVIEAVMLNYRIKVAILESVLAEMDSKQRVEREASDEI